MHHLAEVAACFLHCVHFTPLSSSLRNSPSISFAGRVLRNGVTVKNGIGKQPARRRAAYLPAESQLIYDTALVIGRSPTRQNGGSRFVPPLLWTLLIQRFPSDRALCIVMVFFDICEILLGQ